MAYNSLYMKDYFKRGFLYSSKGTFSCLIKMSKSEAVVNRYCISYSLGRPKGRMMDYFFCVYDMHRNLCCKLIHVLMTFLIGSLEYF